jgi:hypothetical protein
MRRDVRSWWKQTFRLTLGNGRSDSELALLRTTMIPDASLPGCNPDGGGENGRVPANQHRSR